MRKIGLPAGPESAGVRQPYRKSPYAAVHHHTKINCRSARARERGVSGDINAPDPPPSWASALLHRCAAADISKQDTGFAAAQISRQDTGFPADAISKPHTKPVGAGLLANAACQATSMPQTHRNRGQGRGGCRSTPRSNAYEKSIVGARLPANAVCQPTSIPQTHPNLRQARSDSLTLLQPGLNAVQEGFSARWVCFTRT